MKIQKNKTTNLLIDYMILIYSETYLGDDDDFEENFTNWASSLDITSIMVLAEQAINHYTRKIYED